MKYRIGIDIGGTNTSVGVIGEDMRVFEQTEFPTNKQEGADVIIADIINHCKYYTKKYNCISVGIGCPGRLDETKTKILVAGNLPFKDEPLLEKIKNALGLPTYLDNDGSTALLGEKVAGGGKNVDDMIMLTLGTGVGGGIMIGGKVYSGHNSRAGELGHFIINYDVGESCECGLKGCLEQYASVTALIKAVKKAAKENPGSILSDMTGGGKHATGMTAFDAKRKGCPVAAAVLDKYTDYVAAGINSLIKIFQPQAFVISGGITNEGDYLMDMITPKLQESENVFISPLKSDAGLIGAALLATEEKL